MIFGVLTLMQADSIGKIGKTDGGVRGAVTSRFVRIMNVLAGCLYLIPILSLMATSATAKSLSSTNYELLVGHPSSTGHGALVFTPGSRFGSMGYSLGQLSVVGYSGASVGLGTAANGFWPVVVGAYPNIDTDSDGIASPFDDDDDGDGLLDIVESGRGVFLSQSDTGSSPVHADSDGDGFDDFAEVNGGGDPNDSGIFPAGAVPILGTLGMILLVSLVGWTGVVQRRGEKGIA